MVKWHKSAGSILLYCILIFFQSKNVTEINNNIRSCNGAYAHSSIVQSRHYHATGPSIKSGALTTVCSWLQYYINVKCGYSYCKTIQKIKNKMKKNLFKNKLLFWFSSNLRRIIYRYINTYPYVSKLWHAAENIKWRRKIHYIIRCIGTNMNFLLHYIAQCV